ncbi:hypothetical protein ACI0FM_04230 [Paenochrobactrum sp. BZR 588]|uniref:hypothetical protein n=1 Tax=unclassified Paenochrobactrum TaxID=2639760 RepID=UPI0038544815
MMRAFFIALIVGGLGIGFAYPWYVSHFTGSDINRWVMLEGVGQPLQTPKVHLSQDDAPVRIFVDMTPLESEAADQQRSTVRLAVSRDGHPLMSEVLSYQRIAGEKPSNHEANKPMRASAGDINPVITGEYTFSVAPADVEELHIGKIELVLRRAAKPVNDNLISAGLIAVVLGVYGLVRGRLYRRKI